MSERKAWYLPCVLSLTKARPSSRAGERGRESWESPWARYLDEAQGAAGGVKGSCLAELALWEEIEGLERVSKPWPPQRAQSSPDWTVTVLTPYPDTHGDHYLLWLISSMAHRVGTRTYHISMSQLETSVGGKTVPPGGNPVFQSPPLLSLPRDPVQTSTDLRNLYSPQTVTIQIHEQPRLAPAPTLM